MPSSPEKLTWGKAQPGSIEVPILIRRGPRETETGRGDRAAQEGNNSPKEKEPPWKRNKENQGTNQLAKEKTARLKKAGN